MSFKFSTQLAAALICGALFSNNAIAQQSTDDNFKNYGGPVNNSTQQYPMQGQQTPQTQQGVVNVDNINTPNFLRQGDQQANPYNTNFKNAEGTQPKSAYSRNSPPLKPSAFQQFIASSTGQKLPRFGDDALTSGAFTPSSNVPVPGDYVIGAGDEILLRAWGGIDVNYKATVDRDGQLSIPKVGTFPVAGVRAADLDGFLKSQIGKYYQNFNISATLGQLRGIQVYVVGNAETPGLFNVSSLSTLVSAVFSIAKPGPEGSCRDIVLKRGGQEIASFDLYKFLKDGDLSGDRKLLAGDVILLKPAGPRVAVVGAVEKPAVFELKGKETLADVMALAGSNGPLSDKRDLLIETFDFKHPEAPRNVLRMPYQQALSNHTLKDGDLVTVFGISQKFENAVTLRGQVARPLRYPYSQGLRISDLIPSPDALLTDDYYKRTNRLVQYTEAKNEAAGNAGVAGVGSDKKVDLNELKDSLETRVDQVNWDYAVIERLDAQNIQTQLIPFNLRKAIAKDPKEDLQLQPGDVVTVFGTKDTDIPIARKETLVKISGEVNAPGYYRVTPGETLRDVIVQAGGITPNAFLFGTNISRESTLKQQKAALTKALAEAERLLNASATTRTQSALSGNDAQVAELTAKRQQAYLEKLKSIQPDGRLILPIKPSVNQVAELPPVPLEDGDQITIPSQPGFISVFGAVPSQGSFIYQKSKTVFDYLDLAGGPAKSSDQGSIFVIRANGTVDSAQQGWVPFVSGLYGTRALPGDSIYVPEDFERVSFTKSLLDVSQIFYQVGLGAAAVRAIQK